MHFVAVTELASDLDTEAYAIASALGFTVYDVKLRLTGVLPRVMLSTLDEGEAARVASVIRARGNGVVACDSKQLPTHSTFEKLRRFTFDDVALHSNGKSIAWSELAAVIVIAARTDVIRTTIEVVADHRSLRTNVDLEREHVGHEHILDRAAYLFTAPNDDGSLNPPWLLHEREAQYLALGSRMRATRRENFNATLAVFREHARSAIFDERWALHPLATSEVVVVAGTAAPETSGAPRGIDVMVHLLAQSILRGRTGPYR